MHDLQEVDEGEFSRVAPAYDPQQPNSYIRYFEANNNSVSAMY